MHRYPTFSPTRLRVLRKEAGWNRPFLAHRVNLSVSTIESYESGYRVPTAASLGKLAAGLSCSIDELFDMPAVASVA